LLAQMSEKTSPGKRAEVWRKDLNQQNGRRNKEAEKKESCIGSREAGPGPARGKVAGRIFKRRRKQSEEKMRPRGREEDRIFDKTVSRGHTVAGGKKLRTIEGVHRNQKSRSENAPLRETGTATEIKPVAGGDKR